MINKIPRDSDIHLLFTRVAVASVQARTKEAILTSKVLLLKLNIVNKAWNLEPYFADQPVSSDLRIVILLETHEIKDQAKPLKRKGMED